MRLWLLDEIEQIKAGLKALIRVLVERADNEKDILLPGYTHLQVEQQPSFWRLVILVSVVNRSGGRICFSLMHSHTLPITNVWSNLLLGYLFCHLVVVLSQEILS